MSKRLLTILLLVSLFLNAGIIGGVIVMGFYRQNHIVHHYQPGPEGASPREREHYDIPEMQDPRVIALRDSFRAIKKELLQELAKDPVNEARINTIIEQSIGAQSDMERALGHEILEYRKTLGAAEAKEHFNARLERMDRYSERRNNRREIK